MRSCKFVSIFVLSFLSMWLFMPQLSAKHHSRSYRSFGFSLNFNQPAVYQPVVVQPVPVAPTYVERTTYVQPYAYAPAPAPVVEERVYYPYYQQVVVERPCAQRVYVQPQFSYYSAWGRRY